ncbi:two-component sensor histidine kinase [Enemella evansiae]|uniref:sensor histidine kinase n=1 Tax=Enemella evansiae TaxID=2016499 RepID=UPI000B978F48|nr:HAMP domain-containing sensor histidine kinase [Enemella evansiae]OYN97340.1 two-component sensor histidine kinase [Enemella evansiae]
MPQPDSAAGTRIGLTVRARVLLAVAVLSLLAMSLAGVVAYALERQRIDRDIDDLLRRRLSDTTALTERARDLRTGEPLTTTAELLQAAVLETPTQDHESRLGLINGMITWSAPDPTGRTYTDPAFLAAVLGQPTDRVSLASWFGTVPTTSPQLRYLVAPVRMTGDSQIGLLVVTIDSRAEYASLNRNFRNYFLVGAASLLLIWFASWLLIGQLLEPISLLRRTTREITETDLSRRIPVRGNDDLAQLTRTVNAMLDRLSHTFAAQRDLYDDVGHELRTPLTILRGHLEVMDPDDPDDVRAVRARGISEVDRMARLVEDLLTLAKAERPDFIRLQSVDVGTLTDEVLEKARSLGDRQWQLAEVADVRAQLDPQRVSQALLELARNAVKFSEPGSMIAIGSRAEGTEVRFWVRDQGSGIAPELAARVRERFVRGRAQAEGSGLGLAIVSEIAAGHRGTLTIESPHSVGTTISLILPRRPPATTARPFDAELSNENEDER